MDQPLKFVFIPIEGSACYPEFLEEVLLGEQLGFDAVWLEEHHRIRDHYWHPPLVGLAGNIRLIGSVDVAPVDQFEALGCTRRLHEIFSRN